MLEIGYWIGGFGLGENIEERPALLAAVTVRYESPLKYIGVMDSLNYSPNSINF